MLNRREFSVLLSVYYKETADNLKECFDSILKQTVLPNEIVLVKDGALTQELDETIERYEIENPNLFVIVALPTNRGLGLALAEGMLHCSNELVARMDTDDICVKDRFEKQLAEFDKDSDLDICGSHIAEFADNIDNVLAIRKVPLNHEEIAKYQKRRSAFNHMTVMFKKSTVLKAGNYQDAPLMEDDMMWVNMLLCGSKCMNIDEILVYVRTGYGMIERRGGFSYFKKYKKARKQIYKTGYISYWDYFVTLVIQFCVAMMPKKLRLWVFIKLLRR